ncbi:MAG TPA: PilZ domain-containing protein [Tepidisphaeraceae bacterium]|nr:PilZ domain-containing protein [Tepidisphaeraceae bacterium]
MILDTSFETPSNIDLQFVDDDACDRLTLERRRGSRVKLVRPVVVIETSHGRQVAASTCDISHSGLRLKMPAAVTLRPGDQVFVQVGNLIASGLLHARRQVLAARIIWTRRENKMVRPMVTFGLEFITDLDVQVNVA